MADLSDDFTDEEIREELSKLGYSNVPADRFQEFKKDLRVLVQHERSKTSSQNTSVSSHGHNDMLNGHNGFGAGHPSRRDRFLLDDPPPQRYEAVQLEDRLQYQDHTFDKDNKSADSGGNPLIKKPLPRDPILSGPHYDLHVHNGTTTDSSRLEFPDNVSETESEKRFVKRKVLRRKDDGSKVIDESITESEAGSLENIHERLRQLGIKDTDYLSCRRPKSAIEPPYRLSPDDPRPASVILRPTNHPHSKNLRKSDPVARYQQFRRSWSQQRVPGEKTHKNLRWNIREQMLSQDQVIERKPQRVYVANSYVVPTDKKRQNLRWQIRMDMAEGQMPPHGFYHEY